MATASVLLGVSWYWHFVLGSLLFFVTGFLIMLIMVQRGRGGGLAGALGGMGGESALGTKAGDVFTRITVGTVIIWIVLCLVTAKVFNPSPRKGTAADSGLSAPDGAAATADPVTGDPATSDPSSGDPVGDGTTPDGTTPDGTTPDGTTPEDPATPELDPDALPTDPETPTTPEVRPPGVPLPIDPDNDPTTPTPSPDEPGPVVGSIEN